MIKNKKSIIISLVTTTIIIFKTLTVFATENNYINSNRSNNDNDILSEESMEKKYEINDNTNFTQESELDLNNSVKILSKENNAILEDGVYIIRSAINQKYVLDVLRSIKK